MINVYVEARIDDVFCLHSNMCD